MGEKRRIAFRVAYDGTDFLGWQRQATGRTVQGVIEEMLSRLNSNRPVAVVGAGRTDSGVHAEGQVAHAEVEIRYDDSELLYTLRKMSPADLVISNLQTVPNNFHARYSARRRSYRYRIITTPNPFLARYAWHLPLELNVEAMRVAAQLLLGTHDYTTLSKHNPDTPNPICEVYRAEWVESGEQLDFYVTANRFLYGMVRLMVGFQYDVGRGSRIATELLELLKAADRGLQSMAVPAVGLSLVNVEYDELIFT
ncbi:MAG: tRNA pseudouridine(38-40) synthase TruA [Ignavibacteriae bacterium]|nr:tRNA pseudouridine(38-40) synthase TruA [Ignavibacteriota bacterium]MCB9216061.1 tRNA pseudouridine(38-40) synthase TruA [Ignavibacteria bacterium]